MPNEQTYREAVQTEKSPLTRALPGYETEDALLMLFEAALQKTFTELSEAENNGAAAIDEELQPIVTRLAENCFRSGIPEEETVKRTIFHYYLRRKEDIIRQLVRNVYQECKGFDNQYSLSKEQRLSIQRYQPIHLFQPCTGIQSVGRLSLRPLAVGRKRSHPPVGRNLTLPKPALAGTVPPLVPQHGGALAG